MCTPDHRGSIYNNEHTHLSTNNYENLKLTIIRRHTWCIVEITVEIELTDQISYYVGQKKT
jgi:hypothetical protein